MATESQKRKAAAQTGIYLVVITAIVVLANLLSAGSYERFDTTKTERYTLSEGSGRLVRSLKEPVQVEAYVKTGLASLDSFVRDLTDLLKEYERASGGKFKYTIIEPDTDELRDKAREAGIQEQPFGEASATGDSQASIAQGFLGLVFKYGSEKATIPALHPARAEGLEFFVTNKIREIRDKNDDIKHRIGVITGKDELKLTDDNLVARQGQQGSPTFQQIITQNFPFYAIETVDLKGGDEPIDPELAGIMLTQPGSDYTEKELRRIDQFLMEGKKSLVVVASAVNMKPNDATMMAELNTHGIDGLLRGYGIDMKRDAVLDHGAQFRILVPVMGGVGWRRHPGIAHVVDDPRFTDEEQFLDTSFPAFFRMAELMLPYPSTLEILRDKQPGDVKLKAVARTTPGSNVVTSETVDMSMRDRWEPKPPFEQRVIAATAEGTLKSAYAGQPSEDGIEAPEKAKFSSRVLVISSSQFLTNPFAYAGNGPAMTGQMAQFGAMGGDRDLQMIAQPYAQKYLTPTILALKNIFDWMSGDADLIAVSAKILGEPNLTYSSVKKPEFKVEDSEDEIRKKDEEYQQARKKLQRNVQWALTLGLPILFALFGLFRWSQLQSRAAASSARPRKAAA